MTQVYLGLHIGDVFYGNIGSLDRLDFTVVGPAVNEVSRIAAMCRSVERDVLLSSAFADAAPEATGAAGLRRPLRAPGRRPGAGAVHARSDVRVSASRQGGRDLLSMAYRPERGGACGTSSRPWRVEDRDAVLAFERRAARARALPSA